MGRIIRDKTEGKRSSAASEKHASTVEIETTCPICQEPIGRRNPEGRVEGWSMLPCGHRFGSYCIKHYFGIAAEERPLCPICRQAAHHQCGHPFLPIVLGKQHADLHLGISETKPVTGLSLPCDYCRFPTQTVGEDAPGKHASSRWKLPFRPVRWLLGLTPFGRKSRSQSRDRTESGDAPARSEQQYTTWRLPENEGPWIDRFPRYRDPGWERWWNEQAPRGA